MAVKRLKHSNLEAVDEQNILYVLETFDRLTKLKFNCTLCGKEVIIQLRKRLNGKLLCCKCLKQQSLIEKYGSVKNAYHSFSQRREETCLEKYGTKSVFEADGFKEKAKKSKLEKYGDENFNNKDKRKKTCLEKYGVEYNLQSEDFKEKAKETLINEYGSIDEAYKQRFEKIKQTNLERYGVETQLERKDVIDKSKKTKIERYGSLYGELQIKKAKETRLKRYGDENYNNRDKCKKTCLEKYGYTSWMQNPENALKVGRQYSNYNFQNQMLKFSNNKSYELFEKNGDHFWKCLLCGNVYNYTLQKQLICRNCFPKLFGTSNHEKDVVEYLRSQGFEVEQNTRTLLNCFKHPELKPLFKKFKFNESAAYEIDCFVPELRLAVEYDGIYWHSNIDKNYHLAKTEMCKKLGIRLVHWFESDDILKMKDILNFKKKRIYARSCSLRIITNEECSQFLIKYHLQKDRPSTVRLGLYYENELVQVMTFGKPRYNKSFQWELIRECSKANIVVVGGCSKLFTFFEKNYKPKSIISYCDKRLFTGSSYTQLGMTLLRDSSPSYQYVGPDRKVYNRVHFQKHKLSKILPQFDSSATEIQNMLNNGYRLLYDCGEHVYVKNYNYK